MDSGFPDKGIDGSWAGGVLRAGLGVLFGGPSVLEASFWGVETSRVENPGSRFCCFFLSPPCRAERSGSKGLNEGARSGVLWLPWSHALVDISEGMTKTLQYLLLQIAISCRSLES